MIAELLAFVAMVVAVAAPMCGHQGAWPLAGLWRRLKARMPRRGVLRGLGAPETLPRVSRSLQGAPRASQAPSRRAPAWATQQPITHEEAA